MSNDIDTRRPRRPPLPSARAKTTSATLELEPDTIPVEFLPPRAASPSDARFPSMQFGSVRALTATIAATRMFISADTGPMHLASSTAVPTVALFCASDPVL